MANIILFSGDELLVSEIKNLAEAHSVIHLSDFEFETVDLILPDLFIVDLALHEKALDRLSDLYERYLTPILLIAADVTLAEISKIKQIDCAGFIPKPFTKAELTSSIESALSKGMRYARRSDTSEDTRKTIFHGLFTEMQGVLRSIDSAPDLLTPDDLHKAAARLVKFTKPEKFAYFIIDSQKNQVFSSPSLEVLSGIDISLSRLSFFDFACADDLFEFEVLFGSIKKGEKDSALFDATILSCTGERRLTFWIERLFTGGKEQFGVLAFDLNYGKELTCLLMKFASLRSDVRLMRIKELLKGINYLLAHLYENSDELKGKNLKLKKSISSVMVYAEYLEGEFDSLNSDEVRILAKKVNEGLRRIYFDYNPSVFKM